MRDPWSVLGVSRGASRAQIKKAFRELAKKCHPDLCDPSVRAQSENEFKRIAEAHAQLTNRHWRPHPVTYGAATNVHHRRAWQQHPGSASSGGEGARSSNGLLVAILVSPLVLTGVYLARRTEGSRYSTWRPNGILEPPVNPYLRDDLQTTRVRPSPLFSWLPDSLRAGAPEERPGPIPGPAVGVAHA